MDMKLPENDERALRNSDNTFLNRGIFLSKNLEFSFLFKIHRHLIAISIVLF